MKTMPVERAARRVENIEVKYGQPIEPHVRHLVIQLVARGFSTSGSCHGHEDSNPYPWVLFWVRVPKKEPHADRMKTMEALTRTQVRALSTLLGEFYQERTVPGDQRLTVQFKNDAHGQLLGSYCLKAAGADTLDLMPGELLTSGMRLSILGRHRQEMQDFAEFLGSRMR